MTQRETVMSRLAGLREQRRNARMSAELVIERTRTAVADAQAAGISITEIAKVLEMDRSSVYRTYVETP